MARRRVVGQAPRMRRTAAALLEIAAVLAAIVLGGRGAVMLLLVAGTLVLVLRGGSWLAPGKGGGGAWAALGGSVVGALALAGALAISPAVLDVTGRGVEWTTEPVVRGSVQLAVTVALVAVALGVGAELVFRRWLLERVAARVQARGEPAAAALAAGVLVAALLEAAVAPTGASGRLGVALVSAGLGILYVTSGGRLAAPVAARLTFELGAILLQALRVTP